MAYPVVRILIYAFLVSTSLSAQNRSLTILHTNDIHARLSPRDDKMGGFAYLATALARERANCAACLLVNAGDLVQGTPVSTIFHGLPIFEAANLLHYDAATLGNHDFDYGWMQAKKFMATANYPIVSANLTDGQGKRFTAQPYVILKANGLRVAVIGGMTEELKTLSTPVLRGPWHAGPLGDAVRAAAQAARAAADIVVLVAHISPEEEAAMLQGLPELNVIVTGHAHNGLKQAVSKGNRLLVRVRGDAVELGRLDLQVDPATKSIRSWTWKVIPIDSRQLAPEPAMAAVVKHWETEVTRRVDQPLAISRRALAKPAVRTLIERAMRDQTGADFAFMNGGGVRDVLPEGQLLVRHVWNIMPFDNQVVFGTFKGKDLPKVVTAGRTVDPDRNYTLAVTDFTAANQGATSQLQASGLAFPNRGPLLRDLLIDWFRKQQTVD